MDNQTKLVERIALELLRRDGAAVRVQFRFVARGVKCCRYSTGCLHVSRERGGFSGRMMFMFRVHAKPLTCMNIQ